MKKTIYIALLGCAALSAASCNKFLERKPAGALTEEEALKNDADLQALINGAYTDYSNKVYSGKLQWVEDLLGDQANGALYTGDDGEIFKRKTSIFGDYKNGLYTDVYRPAYIGNKVLDNITKASAAKNELEGQAYFLRALSHFDATRLWSQPWGFSTDNSHSSIVLRLKSTVTPGERSTLKAVYESIIADLKKAETLLGDQLTLGNANKWAAKAFLARVYFLQNDFANAYAYADQVIKSKKFQLDASYANRFSVGLSKEIIFGFKFIDNNLYPGAELRNRYRSDVGFSAQGRFHVTSIFYAAATTAGDVRGTAWYSNTLQAGFNVLTKYNKNNFDVPVFGLTEMKLIRAEAGAETNANKDTVLADINDILTRAYGGASKNLPDAAVAATIISTARRERELELVGEGNRTLEIKRIGARTGINIDRRGARWNCPGLVLQFPISEQAANASFQMNQEGGCD